MIFNETTNFDFNLRKTCQCHIETRAANVWDLVQSDGSITLSIKPCLSLLIFSLETFITKKLIIH